MKFNNKLNSYVMFRMKFYLAMGRREKKYDWMVVCTYYIKEGVNYTYMPKKITENVINISENVNVTSQ